MNTYTGDSTTPANSGERRSGLFRATDGRDLLTPFVLITSLFLLWGFCNGMIDILNKHFQDTLRITKEQSGLVQAANYLAYFLMAIPAGLIAKRFGYKGGHPRGAVADCARRLLVYSSRQYRYVLGVSAGPVRHRCGHDLPGNDRQSLRDGAGTAGRRTDADQHCSNDQRRWVGFSARSSVDTLFFPAATEPMPMPAFPPRTWGLGFLWFCCSSSSPCRRFRICTARMRAGLPVLRRAGSNHRGLNWLSSLLSWRSVCGLLYFFIAPILGLIWTLLHMNEALFQPTKYGLLVGAYAAAFLLISRKWDMFRRRHFTLGIAAQFFCVAAQTSIFSFCVNYILENDPGVTRLQASKWLGAIGFGLFMVGTPVRQCGHQPVQA